MISLYQYLHQRQIQRQPVFSVELYPWEYQYWAVFYDKKWNYSVHIHAFATSTYRVDDYGGLWTMDAQGNFKSASVFKVNLDRDLSVENATNSNELILNYPNNF